MQSLSEDVGKYGYKNLISDEDKLPMFFDHCFSSDPHLPEFQGLLTNLSEFFGPLK